MTTPNPEAATDGTVDPGTPTAQPSNQDLVPDPAVEVNIDDVIDAAAQLLSQRLGGTQKISDYQRLQGSGQAIVLRIKLAPTPYFDARTAVVKYIVDTGSSLDKILLMREIVAYQFTTSLQTEVRPGPYLIAHDLDQRLLIISDSGDGDTFAQLLESAVPGLRIEILRSLGEAIGKMHASTAMLEANFDILTRRMMQKTAMMSQEFNRSRRLLSIAIPVGAELLHRHGLPLPPVVAEFAADAQRRLTHGQHRAFTPFGITPDNIIVADRPQFLDYENAGFYDCAFDLASVIAGFPQYLLSSEISDDETDVFIDAWVPEVAKLWPNVQNRDRLHARIITALVGWSLMSLCLLNWRLLALTDFEGQDELADLDAITGLSPDAIAEHLFTSSCTILGKGPVNDAFGALEPEYAQWREFQLLALQDLIETFEALARFARREGDTRFPVVAAYVDQVLEALRGFNDGN
ncbi:MAG: phosphotransferase [Corynebacterium sp.]|nr:phosphotransferase [Corynebacterium sp.]